jgi:3-oxoacyl-(acyl-carrier-protein) synthase
MFPVHKHVYISSSHVKSVTISGPPSVLRSLFEFSRLLRDSRKIKLPIHAAFHASHLRRLDKQQIIGESSLLDAPTRKKVSLFSTSSKWPCGISNLRGILHYIIDDIAQAPIEWDTIVHAVTTKLDQTHMTLTEVGPSGMTSAIHQAFKGTNIEISNSRLITVDPLPKDYSGIAVIGMSGRFPGSENLEEFWDILENGKDLHRRVRLNGKAKDGILVLTKLCSKVPKDRFDAETHCDPSGCTRNTTLTAFGCFIDNPGMFDERFFNMSPRESMQTDPAQRLLLMSTYEALEMAGYSENVIEKNRVGTFMGSTIDDWREYNSSQDVDMYYVSGGMRAFGPGRLNYHFKWDGPSYSIDTACSSSAAAIDLACSSLLSGKCDMAVAGGANIITGSNMYAGLSRGGFLSLTGACKTFDDDADGYCRADGVGVFVLKRLEDAIDNGDNIKGVIRSVATNHSAFATSITQSDSVSQQNLHRIVFNDAGIQPDEIGYIEMHGTGTQVGDRIEMAAVASTFGQSARAIDNPLYLGSIKSNIGHSEAVRVFLTKF